MSEKPNEPKPDDAKPDDAAPPEPKPGDRTARSDDDKVDWVAEARKWERTAKENADAAKRLKELEDRDKSEAQKLADALEAEKAKGSTASAEAARLRAAIKHGLSEEDLDLLGSGTPEEIERRAEGLAQRLAAAGKAMPTASPDLGKGGNASATNDMNKLIRQAAGH